MRSTYRFVVSLAAVLLSGMPLLAQAPSILEPKVERLQGPPLWISAKAVTDSQKIINLDLIDSPFLQKEVERQRQVLGEGNAIEKSEAGGKPSVAVIPASECKSSTLVTDDRGGGGLRGTLADLATYSKSIVRGAVRSVDLGFSFGSPSSLLEIEVSEVIKGPSPKSPFYIDYPVARFRIGPYYFCNAKKGFEPHPGDEILFFDYTGPVDRDQILYVPHLDQIFFQSRNGSVYLPFLLRDTADLKNVRTLDEILNRLRSRAPLESQGGAR